MLKLKKSKINWTNFTWNPWWGCTKISDGCKFCYIDGIMNLGGNNPKLVQKTKKDTFERPLKIAKPSFIFTCSMSDFFHKDADEWRAEAWEIIKRTPHHTYLIVTKRPERILDHLPADWGEGYPNVWLGTTVENNKPEVISRIDHLRAISSKIRFISFEPLLEDLDIQASQLEGIHWGIIGGESGRFKNGTIPLFREAKPEWFRNLIMVLREAKMDIWFKQSGTYLAHKHKLKGKGEELYQLPEDLKLRERPSR